MCDKCVREGVGGGGGGGGGERGSDVQAKRFCGGIDIFWNKTI